MRIPEQAGKSHHNPICRLSNVAILVVCKRKHHYFKWSFSNPLVISQGCPINKETSCIFLLSFIAAEIIIWGKFHYINGYIILTFAS